MTILPSSAIAKEFPNPPRITSLRPTAWVARCGIAIAAVLVILFVLPFYQDRIVKAEQLLRTSRRVQAQITEVKVRSLRGKDDLRVRYRADTAHGAVEGQFIAAIEELSTLEVGQQFPIWYSPENIKAHRRLPPTEEWLIEKRDDQTQFLFLTTGACIAALAVLQSLIAKELKFAKVGHAVDAYYSIDKKEVRGNEEYNIHWSFIDNSGTSRNVRDTKTSAKQLPKPFSGKTVILLSPSDPKDFMCFSLFKWVDIRVP